MKLCALSQSGILDSRCRSLLKMHWFATRIAWGWHDMPHFPPTSLFPSGNLQLKLFFYRNIRNIRYAKEILFIAHLSSPEFPNPFLVHRYLPLSTVPVNDPSNAVGQTVNRRHKPPFVRVYSRVFKSQLPPVARKTNKQNSQDKLGQTSGNNIKYWTIPRCAHDGLHFQLGQDKWKLDRHAIHKEREEGRGEIERQAGQLSNCFHSFMLNSRVVPQDLAWGMRQTGQTDVRRADDGVRGTETFTVAQQVAAWTFGYSSPIR